MPASNIELYYMQDARNNFDAMRPAPVCTDANQFMGQCQNQNIHISTNCYYGFHDAKSTTINHVTTDCEMLEVSHVSNSPQSNTRKRRADEIEYPRSKRHREEVQRERNIERETNENKILDKKTEDLLETLYWNIHGGNIFHIV